MDYLKWNEHPYAGEAHAPSDGEAPHAGSWVPFFLKNNEDGTFSDPNDRMIRLNITHPDKINWEKQLVKVEDVLENITKKEIDIAKYYGTGVATKQWTPVIDRLIDSYGVSAPHAARILAITEAAINDAFIVAWELKYKWLVARPNQYNPNLRTILCTPRHPTYPSGHATIAGCAEEVLSYFFPGAKGKLHKVAETNAKSRLYGGVHFPVDNDEGLKLGRQIGRIVANHVSKQVDNRNLPIDRHYSRHTLVSINPPTDYQQVIPYDFSEECQSLVRNMTRSEEIHEKPRLYI